MESNKLKHFVSPASEASVLKGIPNTDYWHHLFGDTWMAFLNHHNLWCQDVTYRKRFRGPRISGNAQDCKKEDGYSFSVYIRSERYWETKYDDIVVLLAREMLRGGFFPESWTWPDYPVRHWISETSRNYAISNDIDKMEQLFPNFNFYNKYENELESYFADRAQPGYSKMFLNFIRTQ
jgi:hypothetical protein